MTDSQKFPFITALASATKVSAEDNEALRGRELPCHVVGVQGQIVTVQFDMLPDGVQYPQVTIPIATYPYIRISIQVGDKGVTLAADVSLRGISGLGTGIASLNLSPSLTPLFFVPIASKQWSAESPNKVTIYGPEGVLCKTAGGDASVSVDTGKVTIKAPHIYLEGVIHLNGTIVQDADKISDATASLIGPLNVQNDATIMGISSATHKHQVAGVQSGGSTVDSEVPK